MRWKRHLGPLVAQVKGGEGGAGAPWSLWLAGEGPGLALTLLTPDTQHRLKTHHLLFWRRKLILTQDRYLTNTPVYYLPPLLPLAQPPL